MSYLQQASEQLPLTAGPAGELWQTQPRHYKLLIDRIIGQTERRVLAGEPVPAGEKLVSLFEPHADIIVEGSRDVDYGPQTQSDHRQKRTGPRPRRRNRQPADSKRLLPMLERHIAFYGQAPHQGRLCQPR